eukprot:CAMPEP_0117569626 /NCGR_PEP_ID=MMETSP0784-20121206/58759_1 /TAXON_ID=39447 /ORGANISM="" /LENGTH=640 /DNA_ID=CAMNT_0005367613 /DNA_START=14 /DNA_END=1933 /DNA_ORIENTATION=+
MVAEASPEDRKRWAEREDETSPEDAQALPTLHKDFYLRHPLYRDRADCCWGNLEAAHPIIGQRSAQDVDEYLRQRGIIVRSMRGREPPKPFQAFSETSFPDFVEDLAYELFSTDAKPYPVQAQAWPCALSGMDLVAVAPTGGGKTLAFLLPALVHLMAQPKLERNEGPIALVLAPTRELAQQTLAVASRFFERTNGDDLLRAGAVFGGVDPSRQVPAKDAPDYGRWPELLVATPGRLLDLLRRRWISMRRVSYVVLDEADLLLSKGTWIPQVRSILSQVRSDRQLLLFSATWPKDADEVAEELCGAEFVKLCVEPPVPRIPQTVRLFTGADDNLVARKAALVEWLRDDMAAEEAVLVLCATRNTVKELEACQELASVCSTAALLDGQATSEDRASAYFRFVRGEVRALITTFALGARGLDYTDTTAAAGEAKKLSLAVIVFDFPRTLTDYAHCIGRTMRPGQHAGRAVAFLPEMRFWVAKELVALLGRCEQQVPVQLSVRVKEDSGFLADCREALEKLRAGQNPGNTNVAATGDFDADRVIWTLPAAMPSYRRKLLHFLADELGLAHVSTGDAATPEGRRLHIAKCRETLPDKFFVEGEEVEVQARGESKRGVVVDPKIHRQRRTVLVRFVDGREEYVSA